jgi:hypothetical protein
MKPIDPRERFGGAFAASVCCMDGRIQLPIIRFIQERYGGSSPFRVTTIAPGIRCRSGPRSSS